MTSEELTIDTTVTATITLEAATEAHASAVYELALSNQAYLAEWMPWASTLSPEGTLSFFKQAEKDRADNKSDAYLVRHQGSICGVVSFNRFNEENASAEIGYWIGAAFQGKGIVTQAVKALLYKGFKERGLNKIVIRTGTGNLKSAAIAKRLGFVLEGIARENEKLNGRFIDHNVFSLLAHEYQANPEGKTAASV